MSKRFFSTLLVLSLALTAPFAVAQEKANEAAKGPRLTIVEPIKDFGVVPKGQKLDWSFEIRNTGTSDLEILAAKPGCGCTVADFDKVIKPGQSGKVTGRFRATGIRPKCTDKINAAGMHLRADMFAHVKAVA